MMKPGDRVIVIKSPYEYSAPNGTIAVIKEVKDERFGKGQNRLYILANLRCSAFREFELRLL